MNHQDFIEEVQKRGGLSDSADAERATRVVLEMLGEHLAGGEPNDLASQLPPELGQYLRRPDAGVGVSMERWDVYNMVSQREGVDLPAAVRHARAVISVLRDAVTPGEWQDVLSQLPPDFEPLVGSGEGQVPSP
jgi:uncharacterized protein (DUF2267 family)